MYNIQINEGYTLESLEEKMRERKKELATSLLNMVKETEEEFKRGQFTSLENLKIELKDEGYL